MVSQCIPRKNFEKSFWWCKFFCRTPLYTLLLHLFSFKKRPLFYMIVKFNYFHEKTDADLGGKLWDENKDEFPLFFSIQDHFCCVKWGGCK